MKKRFVTFKVGFNLYREELICYAQLFLDGSGPSRSKKAFEDMVRSSLWSCGGGELAFSDYHDEEYSHNREEAEELIRRFYS